MKQRVLTILFLLLFLVGCGQEQQMDYGIEESTEAVQTEGEIWKDTWWTKIGESTQDGRTVDSMMQITVDADVTVPRTEEMSVIEVQEVVFDESWKQKVAQNLFGENEIFYWDVRHLPKKDLRQRENLLALEEEMLLATGSYLLYDEQDEICTRYRDLQETLEGIDKVSDTYTPVEEYTVNEYIGSYEGRRYYLTFQEIAGNRWNSYQRMRQIVWMVRELNEVCPEKYKGQENLICSPWMRGDWIENQCKLTEEEALEHARAFVERLGLDYPVYSFSRPLLWGRPSASVTEESAADDWGIDGYVFYFDLGVENLSFVEYGVEEDYNKRESDQNPLYSMNSRLEVSVTEQGVIRMVANNPMEITGLSDGVELLPLETVKGIVQGMMNEEWEALFLENEGYLPFNSMELIYFRVSDKQNPGKYSYVPAWRLANVTKDEVLKQIHIRATVMLNAIDGSFINAYEEM